MSTSTERMRRMRERRAASIEAADPPALRDADDLLVPAVHETLAALQLGGQDQATAQLALHYAQVIDSARDPAWSLRWIGPELLRCLDALGATPTARAKMTPPRKPGPERPNQLARLRADHTERMKGRTG